MVTGPLISNWVPWAPLNGLLDGLPRTGSPGPLVTGPLVTGHLVTGPLVTVPLITGPFVTGPLVTGPLVTNWVMWAPLDGLPMTGPAVDGIPWTWLLEAPGPLVRSHLGDNHYEIILKSFLDENHLGTILKSFRNILKS